MIYYIFLLLYRYIIATLMFVLRECSSAPFLLARPFSPRIDYTAVRTERTLVFRDHQTKLSNLCQLQLRAVLLDH